MHVKYVWRSRVIHESKACETDKNMKSDLKESVKYFYKKSTPQIQQNYRFFCGKIQLNIISQLEKKNMLRKSYCFTRRPMNLLGCHLTGIHNNLEDYI